MNDRLTVPKTLSMPTDLLRSLELIAAEWNARPSRRPPGVPPGRCTWATVLRCAGTDYVKAKGKRRR